MEATIQLPQQNLAKNQQQGNLEKRKKSMLYFSTKQDQEDALRLNNTVKGNRGKQEIIQGIKNRPLAIR